MDIGEQHRIIVVEPMEAPAEVDEPAAVPDPEPAVEPDLVPTGSAPRD